MLPIKERLNNPGVFRVYRHMIENSPIDVVESLRENIQRQAADHPKAIILEEYFIKRLGK
jgi:hypothetical protein